MEQVDREALNKKLAEWAGFRFGHIKGEGNYYSYPNSDEKYYGYIDFIDSLDACFKWLVPKLQDKGIVVDLIAYEHKGYGCVISSVVDDKNIAIIRNDNPALALCLAIEKLIDEKDKTSC